MTTTAVNPPLDTSLPATVLPSSFSIFFLPFEAVGAICGCIRAWSEGNHEREVEYLLQLSKIPFSFAYSALSLLSTGLQITALFESSLTQPANRAIVIAGFAFCALEGATNGYRIYRQAEFMHDFKAQHTFQYIHDKFFSLNAEEQADIQRIAARRFPDQTPQEREQTVSNEWLAVKQQTLAGRIRPWLVEEIQRTMRLGLIESLNSIDPDMRDMAQIPADILLSRIDIQAQKMLVFHIIGILISLIYGVGLLLMATACPPMIPFILLLISSSSALLRDVMSKGFLDVAGWGFDWKKTIPEWLKSACARLDSEPSPSVTG